MIQLSHNRIITFLLLVAFCIFPFGNLLRFQITPTLSIVLLDCLVALIVCLSLSGVWKKRKALMGNTAIRALGGFYVIGVISLVVNASWLTPQSFVVSGLYGIRFLTYAALFLVSLCFDYAQKKIVYKGLVISGCVMALAGIMQYALFPDLRGFFSLGWDDHLFRLFGTLFDPNFSGAVFVITALLGLDMYWREKKHSLLSGVFILLPLLALILTYSRSSYLMAMTAILSYYVMKRTYRYAVLGIVTVVLAVIMLPKSLQSEGVNLFRTASIEARAHEYTQAFDIFTDNPLVGVGFNTYRYAQLKYGDLGVLTDQPDHAGAGLPNSFLFIFATTGFIGGMFFLFFLMTQMRLAISTKNALYVACICALCVHALFENTLFYPFIMFQYMMLSGVQSE